MNLKNSIISGIKSVASAYQTSANISAHIRAHSFTLLRNSGLVCASKSAVALRAARAALPHNAAIRCAAHMLASIAPFS